MSSLNSTMPPESATTDVQVSTSAGVSSEFARRTITQSGSFTYQRRCIQPWASVERMAFRSAGSAPWGSRWAQ
ncbi:hypothetical protein D3C72_916310 [compost metagenome]